MPYGEPTHGWWCNARTYPTGCRYCGQTVFYLGFPLIASGLPSCWGNQPKQLCPAGLCYNSATGSQFQNVKGRAK